MSNTNKQISKEELSASLILFHKLVNTAQSKTFLKSLNDLWVGAAECANTLMIGKKAQEELKKRLEYFNKYKDEATVREYLEHIEKELDLKITKASKKGLIKGLTFDEGVQIKAFTYFVKLNHPQRGNGLDAGCFESHELIHHMHQYFVVKDTIENKTGIRALDTLIETLLNTKPVEFFSRGYNTDLFWCDRSYMAKHPGKVKYIRTQKDYLSTMPINVGEEVNTQDPAFEFHKVA